LNSNLTSTNGVDNVIFAIFDLMTYSQQDLNNYKRHLKFISCKHLDYEMATYDPKWMNAHYSGSLFVPQCPFLQIALSLNTYNE
jgi:hypothetical protein